MKRPSYNHFADAPMVNMPRSAFDFSFTYKTAFDSGYLIPCFAPIEILPGDTCNLNLQAFARLSTPIVPFMDGLIMDFFFFFVPNRLVLTHWPEVNGAREDPYNPETDVEYLVPRMFTGDGAGDTVPTFQVGELPDYFGLPTDVGNLAVNVLPFRAYNLIYNEWFRAGSIVNSADVLLDDNDENWDDGNTRYALRRRTKRADYFTRALPWPQRGPGVELPLGTTAPVIGTGDSLGLTIDGVKTNDFGISFNSSGQWLKNGVVIGQPVGSTVTASGSIDGKSLGVSTDPDQSALVADLSEASAASINMLRTAFQVQKLYERDARSGGNRYIEILRAHFSVVSPDARLQRPEYLGGGSIPIQIHSVAQTSATGINDDSTPQGNLAAVGMAGGRVGFNHSFVEHGFIIGLVSVRQDQYCYQQGIDRMWSRRSRFDFYWPSLAHLGEQAILNREIYAQGSGVTDASGRIIDDQPFGYQERYAEYRYGISKITGKLRSTASGTLDVWHLGQKFNSLPVLGQTFIEENPPVSRVLAVQNEPQFIYDSVVKCTMVRPMPAYAVPGLVDHF